MYDEYDMNDYDFPDEYLDDWDDPDLVPDDFEISDEDDYLSDGADQIEQQYMEIINLLPKDWADTLEKKHAEEKNFKGSKVSREKLLQYLRLRKAAFELLDSNDELLIFKNNMKLTFSDPKKDSRRAFVCVYIVSPFALKGDSLAAFNEMVNQADRMTVTKFGTRNENDIDLIRFTFSVSGIME